MRLASLLSTLLLVVAIGPAGADTLQMPGNGPADQPSVLLELPAKGMSMRQVETRFGAPKQKIAAVGEPPISRWVYDGYTVYFEKRYVLHAVLNR
jgi:hypothetical protein